MTEREWLACEDPESLLISIDGKASNRVFRLFCCACYRRYPLLRSGSHWHAAALHAIEVAEQFADASATEQELLIAYNSTPHGTPAESVAADVCFHPSLIRHGDGYFAAKSAAHNCRMEDIDTRWQSDILRDIVGPQLFRPVSVDPSWLSSTVVALARGIYDDRAFDRLPILADALEDAGCDSADMLAHCRGEGPHARGCWVVDLLLGKS